MAQQAQWTIGDYSGSQKNVERIYIEYNKDEYIDYSLLYTPIKKDNFQLPRVDELFAPCIEFYKNQGISVEFIDGNTVKCALNGINEETYNSVNENSYNINALGILTVRYDVVIKLSVYDSKKFGWSATTSLYIAENKLALPPWNARTVIERLLIKAETLRASQKPRFHLNEKQAKEFEKIEMPEMHFTNSTLREALQTVGAYIHGEPRLKNGEISFDLYGGNEKNEVSLSRYSQKTYQQSIDSAITSVDSTVDNLVSTMGYAKGVIVEPYENGFKTLRTETVYARITEDNMLIETTYPINRIEKLECGVIQSEDGEKSCGELDITPYVFEESEYTRLSSYSDLFPNSRAYAIYYTQGEKNIKGLNFKQVSVYQALKDYAILNIINAVAGNVFNAGDFDYRLLAFRVTYESITSARVKQSKQCINDFTRKSEIAYNQGQNLIESSYYGEHLKGVAARLGNVDKVITIVQRGKPNIPKVGTLYDDDYYISAVATEYQPYHTKISCALSKDFNRYSDYVSINSTRRFYEVSERQAYDSFINYRDYVVIGDSYTPDSSLPNPMLINAVEIRNAFRPKKQNGISLVKAQGFMKEGGNYVALNTVILPVKAMSMGNAAIFTFKYKDNYSAGDNANYREEKDDEGKPVEYQYQNSVQYKDYYGRMEYLKLDYYKSGTKPRDWGNQWSIGNALPDTNASDGTTIDGKADDSAIGTGDDYLWLGVGSTEIPTITYQLEFVTNRRSIIVGSALARNLPLVGNRFGREHSAKLYVLPGRLNKFSKTVDLTGATLLLEYGEFFESFFSNPMTFKSFVTTVAGESWAIVDGATNELLIGENKAITGDGTTDILGGLTVTLTHEVI